MARVLVAMSGGVDSSVAAAMLVEQGHDVTGVTLKLWGGEGDSGCCGVRDTEDARRVAAQLGIPHYVFNFAGAFENLVVEPYVASYASGRTPNPCIECNRTMKWGRLLDRAIQMGFDSLATGHHARVVTTTDGLALARGLDHAKDQSYVLYMLSSHDLARTLLPVGTMTKREVRERAARAGLRSAFKPDSQDVCFVASGDRKAFLSARLGAAPGAIVDTAGQNLGSHEGVHAFTIGQRRGLHVSTGERRYVLDVDAKTATVTVGDRTDLLRDEVHLRDPVFARSRPAQNDSLLAQSSAHGRAVACTLAGDTVRFASPQQRVAPGQVVALYDGDVLRGGGVAA